MEGFNLLQLISIKHPIFNIQLNIFLFNNWKKLQCLQISKLLRFKMIWSSSFETIFRGSNFVQNFGPSYKKRRLWNLLLQACARFLNIFSLTREIRRPEMFGFVAILQMRLNFLPPRSFLFFDRVGCRRAARVTAWFVPVARNIRPFLTLVPDGRMTAAYSPCLNLLQIHRQWRRFLGRTHFGTTNLRIW